MKVDNAKLRALKGSVRIYGGNHTIFCLRVHFGDLAIYMTIKDFYFEQEQSGLLVVLAVCSLPLSAVFTYFIVQLLDYITI